MKKNLPVFTKRIFILFVLSFSFLTCNRDNAIVPYVFVNFHIDLNDPEYTELNAVGNAQFLDVVMGERVGHQGIVIYHKSMDEFTAFDRASTSDPSNKDAAVVFTDEWGVVEDTVNGSRYSLPLDGAVVGGPASAPLQQYQTSYNSSSRILYVSN